MKKGFESINIHGCANAVVPIPAIGENGNWFIGNDDTGVSTKGEQGEAGSKGDKGEQGDIGPAGPQGIQGMQGEQGVQGVKGDKGDKGEQGIQGAKGEQGVPGVKGDKGEKGEQGNVGSQGPKGEDADPAEIERLDGEIAELNQSLNNGNCKFDYVANDGLYYNVKVGADTVRKKCNSEIYMTNVKAIVHSSASNAVAQCDMEFNVEDYTKLNIGTLSYSDCAYYTANKFIGYKRDGTEVNYTLGTINDIKDIVKFYLSINAVRKNTSWGVGALTLSHLKIE